MIFFRPIFLTAALVSLVGVAFGLPEIIRNSDYGIRWLYDQAYNGHLAYDLSADFPPLQQPWNHFLQNRGGPIINTHYAQNQGAAGWDYYDREHLLDRVSGRNPSDHTFPADRVVARQTLMILVERFAEEQAAARAAAAAQAAAARGRGAGARGGRG